MYKINENLKCPIRFHRVSGLPHIVRSWGTKVASIYIPELGQVEKIEFTPDNVEEFEVSNDTGVKVYIRIPALFGLDIIYVLDERLQGQEVEIVKSGTNWASMPEFCYRDVKDEHENSKGGL